MDLKKWATNGGPIVCARMLPPTVGKDRKVARVHCTTTGCDSIFVFERDASGNDTVVGYCCFDPKTSPYVTDDAQFVAWARQTLQGEKFYMGTYASKPADPAVDCPPPITQLYQVGPHELTP